MRGLRGTRVALMTEADFADLRAELDTNPPHTSILSDTTMEPTAPHVTGGTHMHKATQLLQGHRTTHSVSLFDVDPEGMRKAFDNRGKAAAAFELVANGLDTKATVIDVILRSIDAQTATITVSDDDPDGFARLRDAYTVYAESIRKDDPETRGRFNLGEKQVIVLCDVATIATTSGTLRFDASGRTETDVCTESGSIFDGIIRMTPEEVAETITRLGRLIVPAGRTVTLNGVPIPARAPVLTFTHSLVTVLGDVLRRTERVTPVTLYEPASDSAWLYELGIPVCALDQGDRFDIDVAQKVPLTTERNNVTAGYLRTLRMVVLNNAFALLSETDRSQPWTTTAAEHPEVSREAFAAVMDARWTKRRTLWDGTDLEANDIAVATHHKVIPTRGLTPAMRANNKRFDDTKPSGKVTPSPSAALAKLGTDPNADIPPDKWNEGERRLAAYTRVVGQAILGFEPMVRLVSKITFPFAATWGGSTITYNRGKLGKAFFSEAIGPDQDALILHEFAHHRVHNHLSAEYADEVARLGGLLAQVALDDPQRLTAVRGAIHTVPFTGPVPAVLPALDLSAVSAAMGDEFSRMFD